MHARLNDALYHQTKTAAPHRDRGLEANRGVKRGYAITVTDIRKNFGAVEALNGVSLDVAEGEKVVIIGPSGSGKSVLIRCINGLEVPDSGTVVVEG